MDQPDAGVDPFHEGVGQSVVDGGDDAVEVVADAPGQCDEGVGSGGARHQRFKYVAALPGAGPR